MKFDVIIGNPPYQIDTGNKGGNKSKAQAVYHLFISEAINLEPEYLSMITPSRWMTKTAAGIPDHWVEEIISSNKFKSIYDYPDASVVFPDTPPRGGVNYFIWGKNYSGKCNYFYNSDLDNQGDIGSTYDYLDDKGLGLVIRDPRAKSVINKIDAIDKEYYARKSFSSLVSPKDFFTNKKYLTSRWDGFQKEKDNVHYIKYYPNRRQHGIEYGFIKEDDIPKNRKSIKLNKVYIPSASGTGSDSQVLSEPFVGEKDSVCSQTYLVIGYDPNEHNLSLDESYNIVSYIKTKFFRYLVSIKKITQNGARGVYQFVPLQDFSHGSDIDWSQSIAKINRQLYRKYNLNDEEIKFIEDNIKEME